ncbi:MAG TPA: hypothetical protein VIF57_15620 [Polyangia bacterium]|jgi:hypothetical protein
MPATTPQPRRTARTLAVIGGAVAGFLAVGLLIAGGVVLWVNGKKDDAGYIATASEPFATNAYAMTSGDLDVKLDAPGWIVNRDNYGKVRLKVSPHGGKPVFVGVAPTRDVEAYLGRSAHETVSNISYSPFSAAYSYHEGKRRPGLPTAQPFWAASVHGSGAQTLTWNVKHGSWSIVVMNADGSAVVDTAISAGARLPFLAALGWGSVGGGLLLLAAAGGLVFVGQRAPRRAVTAGSPLETQPAAA